MSFLAEDITREGVKLSAPQWEEMTRDMNVVEPNEKLTEKMNELAQSMEKHTQEVISRELGIDEKSIEMTAGNQGMELSE